jgi:hypothetical protein
MIACPAIFSSRSRRRCLPHAARSARFSDCRERECGYSVPEGRLDKGALIAIEREKFRMGGGYTAEFRPADKVQPREEQIKQVEEWLGYAIPERCLTSDVYGVWVVGDTSTLSAS